MDFSGHAGRVIENPREALNAAMEEAQAWRVRASYMRASVYLCVCCISAQGAFMEWEGGRGVGEVVDANDTQCHAPHCRRRQTTASACPPHALGQVSAQVGGGLGFLGWAAVLF